MSTPEMKYRAGLAAHYEPFQRFMYAIGFVYMHGLFDDARHYYPDFGRLADGVKYGEKP